MTGYRPPARLAAATFLRELLRQWPTLAFMLALPAAYFAVSYATDPGGPDRDAKAVHLAVLGIGVSSAFGALTAVRGSAEFTRRLRLAGFPPGRLLAGRAAVLLAVTGLATACFVAVLLPLVPVADTGTAALALVEVGLIGAGLGALLGSLLSRELEAAMILVAVCGIQLALGRSGADAERWLLFTPAVDALRAAVFADHGASGSLLRGSVHAAALLGLAYLVFARRTRVVRHP